MPLVSPWERRSASPFRDRVVVGGEQAALAARQHLVGEEREAPRPGRGCRAARRDRVCARGACAASSISASPRASQSVRSASTGAAYPAKWTTQTARVRPVSAASTSPGSSAEIVRPDDVRRTTGMRAAVAHGGRRGGEGHRRDDHLVAGPDARAEVGQVQRSGAAGQRDRVADAEVLRRTPARTPRSAGPSSASPSAARRRPPRGRRSVSRRSNSGTVGRPLTRRCSSARPSNGSPKRRASRPAITSSIPSATRMRGT